MNNKVSVIIPVYNASAWLDKAIRSVVYQSHSNWELIAIDDDSTDDSLDKLKKWESQDNRIRIFHKVNEGPARARAFGLKKAVGDFIFYLDADDFISIDMFELCISAMDRSEADIAMPNLIQINNGKIMVDSFIKFGLIPDSILTGQQAFERSISWSGVWSYMMCKKDLFKTYACDEKYLYGNFNSDELITRIILLNCKKIVYCSGRYYYNYNTDSITKKISPKIFGYLDTYIRFIGEAQKYGQSRKVLAKIETTAFREMIDLWHKYNENKHLFSNKERKHIINLFLYFYQNFPKENTLKMISVRQGITPKLQCVLMFNGWNLCRLSLSLAAKIGKKNKLSPWFSEGELESLE